mmetsp:Transcript_89915/g.288290  ORF Transcript_89915/g.288290 Transcript_89915/m.288290 type:complete len:542 (-) Transcript_89915:89-1714(-)
MASGDSAPPAEWTAHYAAFHAAYGEVGEAAASSSSGDEQARALEEERRWPRGLSSSSAASIHPPPSFVGATVNMTKCLVGSGMLAVPSGLKGSSLSMGIAGLVATGILSALGFLAIGRACMLTRSTSYREAWMRVGGRAAIVDAVLFFECLLSCTGYSILLGDYAYFGLSGLAPRFGFGVPTREILVGVISVVFVLPLCLVAELRALSKTSALGLLAILYAYLYVVGTALLGALGGDDGVGGAGAGAGGAAGVEWFAIRSTTFPTLTTFVSAYVGHFLAPTIWAECLEAADSPQAAWGTFRGIVVCSFGLAGASYISFGVAGYLYFGGAVRSNVLTNFPAMDADGNPHIWTLLCWVLMALSFALSYPLVFRSARDTAADVLGIPMRVKGPYFSMSPQPSEKPLPGMRRRSNSGVWDEALWGELVRSRSKGDLQAAGKDGEVAGKEIRRPQEAVVGDRMNWRWALFVAVLVLLTNAAGLWMDDIGWLLALRGATLGCPLCFVLPGLLLLRCGKGAETWRGLSWALVVFGSVFGTLSVYYSVC